MPERRHHRVSEGQDGRSKRPASGTQGAPFGGAAYMQLAAARTLRFLPEIVR